MKACPWISRSWWLALVAVGQAMAASADNANRISGVQVHRQGGGAVVEIRSERSPNFTTFKQDRPLRVVIDVAGATLQGVPSKISGDGSLIGDISTQQLGGPTGRVSRFSILLLKEAEYQIRVKGNSLLVQLKEGSGGVLASAGVPTWDENEGSSGESQGRDLALAAELAAPTDGELAYASAEPDGDSETEAVREKGDAPRLAHASIAAPRPPVGVVASPKETPAAGTVAEPRPEPKAPRAAEADGGRTPTPSRPAAGSTVLVAQAEEVEEVEEVEDVPAEVSQPPKPAPAPAAEAESPEEVVPPPPLNVEEKVPPPPPPAPARERVAVERVQVDSAIKHMTWVGFQQTQESSRVFVKTNSPVRYRVYEEGDRLVVLELENTRIPLRNNRRFLDTHFFESAVTMITPREIEGVTASVRIEIALKNKVPFRAAQEDNMVYISFERPK